MNARTWTLSALALAVFASALLQVWVVHENRKSFVELERLHAQRDELNIEWSRLQIEQAAWATHSRIEQEASNRLDMVMPGPEQVVIIRK